MGPAIFSGAFAVSFRGRVSISATNGEVFTVESPAGRRRVGHENLEGMDGLEKG